MSGASASGIPDPAALLTWLRGREGEMAEFLVALASVESPSLDAGTQPPVFALLRERIEGLGFRVRRVPGHTTGSHLFAVPRARERSRPNQLLLGHMDTVWPVGTLGTMPVREDDGRLAGPGTFDMKAGLVQAIWALEALRVHDVEVPATPVVFVNSDEEIGSRDSRGWVRTLAQCSVRAFVFEGSFGLDGRLKTGRKGVGRFEVRVKGTAAHAGIDPESGVSAVLELSHQIQALFSLNDAGRGITVNVGTVDGGLRPNVVAPDATADVDVRVPTLADARTVEAAIRGLTPVSDGAVVEVSGGFGRPPMEENERNLALWERAEDLAGELGLPIDRAAVGGASDGNLTSQYTATLDGLGAVGDGAHAPHEHVVVEKMPERAALTALLLSSPVEA